MIYDEVRRAFRVDEAGVKALFGNGVPHGCQVHHGRYSTVKKTPEEEKWLTLTFVQRCRPKGEFISPFKAWKICEITKTEAATWSTPGGWDAEDETLTWSPGGGLVLERMAPRLYSVAAASPGCSGRRPLLCKSHRSYGSLLPARHGWKEAACLHTANRDGSFISLCKQHAVGANEEITTIGPRYTACKWNVNWRCVRTIKNQINAGSKSLNQLILSSTRMFTNWL